MFILCLVVIYFPDMNKLAHNWFGLTDCVKSVTCTFVVPLVWRLAIQDVILYYKILCLIL